jgi:iron complex outermembrane receptor protein
MFKLYFFLFFSFIITDQSTAQTSFRSPVKVDQSKNELIQSLKVSLSGKITDSATGLPLSGTSVYFPDLKTGAASDNNGYYIVSNISAGKYLVEVSHLGYSSVIETIDLSGDTRRDFALIPSIIENEAVTVTGVSRATSTKRTPIPVNIVNKTDLFRNTSTNLIDNISKTPGVAQVSTGPAISKPFIRGLGYNRVLVISDGIQQEGQQWGDEHGIEIDEQNVNKVEILKGPASLMYGSDALAGVINIISFISPPEGRIKGSINTGYMTNNRQRNLHAEIGGNRDGFVWGVNGSYKAAADYQNKYDGYVFNSKFFEKDFGVYTGLNKNWGYSHLFFTKFDQTLGLVEGDRDDATGKFLKLINNNGLEEEEIAVNSDFKSLHPYIPKQRIRHTKIVSDNSFRFGKNHLTVVTGYQRNQRQEFGNILQPGEYNLYFDLGTFNYSLQYHFAEKNNWKTTIGIGGQAQTNTNKGTEQLIPEYSLFDAGTFIYTQKRINDFTISGGVRFDNRSVNSKGLVEGNDVKFTAFKKNFSNFSGSAGFAWQLNKQITLKLNTARGFRAPSIPELASNGAHEGTNRYEYGELSLKSETSWQTDAGVEWATEHVSLNANVFVNVLSNFIYYRKLLSVAGGDSLITDGQNTYFAFRFSQGNANLFGAEFNLDIHPHPLDWLHIENTFSWVRGMLDEAQDGSKNLPFIPAARLINEIKVEVLKRGKSFRNLFIKAELDNTFAQSHPFTGYNTETATPGYSLLNMGVGGEVRKKDNLLFTVFFSANNVANTAYQNHLSRLKYAPENLVTGRQGVYNMGRNFAVKINIPLEFKSK